MLRFRVRSATAALVGAGITGALLVSTPSAAVAAGTAQPTVVGVTPASYTPDVQNGIVYAIGQVGSTVYLGGSFTSIAPHASSSAVTANYIAAFTAGTGALVSSFAPTLDGQVSTIIPGPTAGTVYVGGSFKTVDGVSSRLALLNASTGAIVPGWSSPSLDGAVNSLKLAAGHLFVGGDFDAIGGTKHNGLAALNPTTGAVTSYSSLAFTGHHNYGVNCTSSSCADGGVGIKAMDVNPAGTRLVVIGNFTSASGAARDQVAMLDLGSTSATLDPWATDAFTAGCASSAFDSWIRDVQFSPDGSYFAVASAGGGYGSKNSDGTTGLCDSVARFDPSATGSDVQPTWVDWTGNDSFWSVAVTGAAIYVGGHERWLNNSNASDSAGPGSVPRPGMAAVDPVNGMPIAWNPGRDPRGAGAYALLATADGLYVGSDTDWIGDYRYHHEKVAFFPLTGGETLPANTLGTLPGNVYLVGRPSDPSNVESVSWNGSSAAPGSPTTYSGIDWSSVRGAFALNGQVFYASTNGNFYERSFDGNTFGATATTIDPYDDPTWSTVGTGNPGGGTYRGVKPGFYSQISSLTSLFYAGGRIYYTLSGDSHMYYRYFESDDGVIGSQQFTTTASVNWSNVSGAFVAGSTLYYADATSKNLMSVPFSGGQASGTPSVANSSINWTSHGLFALSSSTVPPNKPPVASFTASCSVVTSPCSFDGSASSDPDGTIASYHWDFGDGATASTATTSHTFSSAGDKTVTLTVTDNSGASNSVSHTVHVSSASASPVAFRAAAASDASTASPSVTVPSTVASSDEMLLFASWASTSVSATTPAGWTLVGSTSHSNLSSAVYARSATGSDAGSAVTVSLSGSAKASLTLAAYSNADATLETSASATDTSTASHKSPTVTGLSAGSYAISFWTDKSTGTTAWTAPSGVTQRSVVVGTGGGADSALVADSGAAVSGSYGGLTATTNATSGSGAEWTVALSPAG